MRRARVVIPELERHADSAGKRRYGCCRVPYEHERHAQKVTSRARHRNVAHKGRHGRRGHERRRACRAPTRAAGGGSGTVNIERMRTLATLEGRTRLNRVRVAEPCRRTWRGRACGAQPSAPPARATKLAARAGGASTLERGRGDARASDRDARASGSRRSSDQTRRTSGNDIRRCDKTRTLERSSCGRNPPHKLSLIHI